MNIEGSTAVVTGGARGLGKGFVDELLVRGAKKVYAVSRTAFEHPDPRVATVAVDVTDPQAVAEFAVSAPDVDLVISNAGFNAKSKVLGGDVSGLRAELETNLFGLVYVVNAFAETLAVNGGGAVLNVHSVRSWLANGTGYSVSKAAAWSATNGTRLLLRSQGTLVTGLHVGLMDTEMTREYDGDKSDPRVVAGLALDGIEAGDVEVLADELSAWAKARLSEELSELFPEIV
jgi:NAD(P)-dependent dehydrogenase (short-subunit alcohol dehydrogenase family)